MCKSIVEHLLRVTCPNRAGRQSRMLWAGGVPAEVAWPAPTLETPLSLCCHRLGIRSGQSRGPRQAMALWQALLESCPVLLPFPRCEAEGPVVFRKASVSGLFIYQIFSEKLTCTRPCAVWRIRASLKAGAASYVVGLPSKGAGRQGFYQPCLCLCSY